MIKKNRRWIALAVVCTFAWLMQVAALPAAEQSPGFYEAAKPKPAPEPKKSILPIVLIGAGVAVVAAVLFLVVLKTSYDIRGTWNVTTTWQGNPPSTWTITFSGEKDEGTFHEGDPRWVGGYTVKGKKVTWQYAETDHTMIFRGTFTGKDSLEGTMTDTNPDDSGTFTAKRTAAATASGSVNGPGGKGRKTE